MTIQHPAKAASSLKPGRAADKNTRDTHASVPTHYLEQEPATITRGAPQHKQNGIHTCRSSFQPNFFSKGLRTIPIMATIATSAAPPWMGVLIAAREPWETLDLSLDVMSGSFRYLIVFSDSVRLGGATTKPRVIVLLCVCMHAHETQCAYMHYYCCSIDRAR